ncbi:hypothetical protein [uncultured Tenacibaculum sp.]|uniref:hypothetical protein n=1 Tax=uncultured Tenacibaculum sp. TaxID=174713 RepID=UPI00262BF6D0|nr:hypothetical protein [uncultured Tenacibaculum sp.]
MTPQEKYVKALKDLLQAQKEVQAAESNPFNLGLPTHLGLSDETFITNEQLAELSTIIGEASENNQKFAKIWNLGTDIILKAKSIFL